MFSGLFSHLFAMPTLSSLSLCLHIKKSSIQLDTLLSTDHAGRREPEVLYRDRFVEDGVSAVEVIYLPLGAMLVHRAMIALTLG